MDQDSVRVILVPVFVSSADHPELLRARALSPEHPLHAVQAIVGCQRWSCRLSEFPGQEVLAAGSEHGEAVGCSALPSAGTPGTCPDFCASYTPRQSTLICLNVERIPDQAQKKGTQS